MSAWDAQRVRLALALVALVIVAYLPALRAGWIWDDDYYVTANVALRSLGGLARLWLEPGVVPQYYPVTFTSLWIDWQLWGSTPLAFHLTNVLLHAAAVVLAWRVLAALGVPGCWLAAALFAVHPVQVESVAWVTERKNVLSAVFYFAAALVFVTRVACTPADDRRRRAYLGVVVLFVLALLSKTVTGTLPAVLAIALWWRDGRVRREDLLPLASLLVVGAGAAVGTAWIEHHHVGAIGPYWNQTFAERCLVAGRALWFYAGKLVWPVPVAFNYERWVLDVRDPSQWLWPVAAIVVGAAVWLGRSRLGRGPAAALACFAVTLAPALGFVDVYPMRYAFVADHFQYLASLALLTLAAGLGRRFVGRSTVALPVVAVLATLTCRYTLAYGDVETLWRDTVAKNPRSVLALQNLGTIEFDRGDAAGALALYDRALAVEPDQPDVANSSGIALARLGRLDEARARFEAALRVDPEHAEAARNLGSVLAAAGRREEAIAAYEQALRAKPDFVDAHEDVAVLLEEAGALDRAEAHLRAAVRLDPDSLDAHARLGALLRVVGKPAAAAAVYEQAVRLAPTSYDAWVALADASAEAGDAARAVVATERALAIARAQNRPGAIPDLTHRLERLGNQGRS